MLPSCSARSVACRPDHDRRRRQSPDPDDERRLAEESARILAAS